MPDAIGLKVLFVAGFGPVVADAQASRAFYADTLQLPLEAMPTDPDYLPVGIDHVFDMTNMPSYRLTIDMRDLDGARLIITTGQSGNPFDRHYNDQIGPWIEGETVSLPFTPAAIAAAMASTLTLTP